MRAVRQAGTDWAEAMRAHKLAPPDAGFAARLRALSDAAGREQVAWEHAHAAGLLWRPIPGAESAEPPYELRPGTGRRGPAELWARFDQTVASAQPRDHRLDAADVADAFGELSEAAGALATRRRRGGRNAAPAGRARARAAACRPAWRALASVALCSLWRAGPGSSTESLQDVYAGPKVGRPRMRPDTTKERDMPQIIVTADHGAAFGEGSVTFRERVSAADFESEHFAMQLVERLGWAVRDDGPATARAATPGPPTQRSSATATRAGAGQRSVASVVTTAS